MYYHSKYSKNSQIWIDIFVQDREYHGPDENEEEASPDFPIDTDSEVSQEQSIEIRQFDNAPPLSPSPPTQEHGIVSREPDKSPPFLYPLHWLLLILINQDHQHYHNYNHTLH